MRIGMLTQWFDPEPGPAAVPGVLARELRAAGHEVAVLTGFPNYPDGRIHDGYRQRLRDATRVDGVHVTRVPLYPHHSAAALGRVANYGSFAASATVLGAGALAGADAVWVYNSPVTVSLPLLTHTRGGRVPYFLHVQDLWPDSLTQSGMLPGGSVGRGVERVVERVVRLTERRAAVVGVLSPGVRDLVLERNPDLDPDQVVHAPNPTDERLFAAATGPVPDALADAPWRSGFALMYAGAMGSAQGLETVVEAASQLRDRDDVHVVLVGDGNARVGLEDRARRQDLHNVHFVGRVPKESVPAYLRTAAVQLVSLADAEFLRYTVPSKIPTLLASGVPVLGHVAGESARLLGEAGAGPVVRSGDADGLVRAIRELSELGPDRLAALGSRGRQYYEQHLSARACASVVSSALAEAAGAA